MNSELFISALYMWDKIVLSPVGLSVFSALIFELLLLLLLFQDVQLGGYFGGVFVKEGTGV